VADTQEEYHTLNPLFPCSDPIPVVASLKKNVFILFGVLTGILLISTIVLAILFAIERNRTTTIPNGKKLFVNNYTKSFVFF